MGNCSSKQKIHPILNNPYKKKLIINSWNKIKKGTKKYDSFSRSLTNINSKTTSSESLDESPVSKNSDKEFNYINVLPRNNTIENIPPSSLSPLSHFNDIFYKNFNIKSKFKINNLNLQIKILKYILLLIMENDLIKFYIILGQLKDLINYYKLNNIHNNLKKSLHETITNILDENDKEIITAWDETCEVICNELDKIEYK